MKVIWTLLRLLNTALITPLRHLVHQQQVSNYKPLFRTVKEVICCYDGDNAGRDAAWRAMENALPLIRDGYSLKFVFLPDGEDPDSLVREQGQQAFENILDTATPLSEFLFDHLLSQADSHSLEGRAKLIDSFQPYLAKVARQHFKRRYY